MSRHFVSFLLLLCSLWAWANSPALAREHRATHLGNPATRFAAPLKTPDDLRRMLLSEALRADVAMILRQSDYLGDLQDFRDAVAKATIHELFIPPGTLLPSMSTRLQGRPVLLRQVRWAGAKPIAAYEFTFDSKGRRYRVVTPKPCSNFWVEEVLPRPAPILSLACEAPAEQPLPRSVSLCHHLRNSGNATAAKATLSLPIPAGASLVSTTGTAEVAADRITWSVSDLAPGGSQALCATFVAAEPGTLSFASVAVGERAAEVQSQCTTRIYGIPAVLLEVVDLADPVLVGKEVVYTIRVLNQGSEPLSNIRIAGVLEDSQAYLSSSGMTAMAVADARITAEPLPRLNPKEEATWRVVIKALKAADVRFAVELRVDQFSRPVMETEATLQY